MKDDFLACLTSEIRDEVMERYVNERRIAELQIESLQAQAQEARSLEVDASKRLTRLGYWMMDTEARRRIVALLGAPTDSPWRDNLAQALPYELHSIVVSAFRDRAKLRKLIIKAYERAHLWMARYGNAYENLRAECDAVKTNIRSFEKNFSLQTVLGFLKHFDTCSDDKARILGGNFSAEEISSVERTLSFRVPSMEDLHLPAPLPLPDPDTIEPSLIDLSDSIYDRHRQQVKELIESMRRKGY